MLFSPGTAAEVRGLERIVARHGRAGRGVRSWLEPACGSGRYLRAAAARGHRVMGFDLEPAMVAYARAELRRLGLARRMTVFQADMLDFAAQVGRGRIDFAFNLQNTIRHLRSDRELAAHLAEMAAVLAPGGLYAIGVSLTEYGHEGPSEDVWRAARGDLRVEQIVQYVPPSTPRSRRETVYSHLTIRNLTIRNLAIRDRGRVESRSSHYRLRCYDAAQWGAAIARSPFEVVDCVNERGSSIGPLAWPYGIQVLRRRENARRRPIA